MLLMDRVDDLIEETEEEIARPQLTIDTVDAQNDTGSAATSSGAADAVPASGLSGALRSAVTAATPRGAAAFLSNVIESISGNANNSDDRGDSRRASTRANRGRRTESPYRP